MNANETSNFQRLVFNEWQRANSEEEAFDACLRNGLFVIEGANENELLKSRKIQHSKFKRTISAIRRDVQGIKKF
jgi:hypothetical protein